MASRHHLRVGSTVRLSLAGTGGGPGDPREVPVSFQVVGIEASANDFPPQHTGMNSVWATPAFRRGRGDNLVSVHGGVLRLAHGRADLPAFENEVSRLAGGKPATLFALADQAVNTEHSIHLQAVALWALAALLGLTGLLVVAQLLVRQGQLESGDQPTLAALGMDRGQRWAVGMVPALAVGAGGAAVAAALAFLLSPLTPVGLARIAEPRPGLAADPLVLGLGALATAALVAAAGAWPAWRAARAASTAHAPAPSRQSRPSVVAGALARAGAPVPVTAGVRLALEPGRGRTGVPVRSTLVGAVVGVAALATALAFSASLDHLLATPRLYGVTWDAEVTTQTTRDLGPALAVAGDDPAVSDLAVGYAGFPLTVGHVRVDGVALRAERGASLMPAPLEGRRPTGPGEVMLGSRTMAALHTHVGATIKAVLADASPQPVPLRVVGRAVFPSLSPGVGLGKGAALTPEGLAAMVPGTDLPPPDTILVRFRPGVDGGRAASGLAGGVGPAYSVLPPETPVDLVNFGRVQALPLAIGGLLGTFAAATLAHLLVTSIRRRRRDLAILKTLGLAAGSVRATVAWQSTALAVVAALAGVPVGLAAGRAVWSALARQLGVVATPVVPAAALAGLAAGTVVVANLVAALPARAAAGTRPAAVLRSE
jgi:ABC-type lipoprotein release transport system permease subunit